MSLGSARLFVKEEPRRYQANMESSAHPAHPPDRFPSRANTGEPIRPPNLW